MNAKPLPYAWTKEQLVSLPCLSASASYVVVPDDLQTRLDTASRRVAQATTPDERERAEAECDAVWRDIDAHEQEEREAEEERRADGMTSRAGELR